MARSITARRSGPAGGYCPLTIRGSWPEDLLEGWQTLMAGVRVMWNMSRAGFGELLSQIPHSKPDLDTAWRLTGGNPDVAGELAAEAGT
ncbi:ATP-binding protein [Pyrobaculum islandicum]|uniref:ATP-binding protein n=1 Tax=Pyrobaculum islandicum TaxID=2277 RepID=UPI001ADFD945|nr:ATP-binding protein [Pyrobaculum islandicum]